MKADSLIPSLAAGALAGSMLVFPREAASAVLSALTDFAAGVLPGLLPFSICALLLTAGRSLPMPALTLLALPGGSPTGARLLQDAGLSPAQAKRAAARTGGMSPMFFLATLSGWLGDARAGALLLISHIAATLLCGCMVGEKCKGRVTLPPLSLPQAAAQGGQAMLTAASCAALGAAAARMIGCALPRLPGGLLAALQAMLEITGGTRMLCQARAPLPLIAGLTGFTGLSILLQNAAFWQRSGLTLFDLCKTALLRAGLSAALMLALYQIFSI